MAAPGDVSPFLPSALGGSEEVGAADRKTSLAAAGLDEYLAAMTASGWSEAESIRGFRYSWMQSVLDHVSISDAVVGSFASDRHDRAIDDFMEGDRQHIADTATRIRRLVAEHAVEARNEHPEQESLVAHQARLKRRHLPVRDVIGNAADVLLALKPCWAMSPLVVSQLLPPNTYFAARNPAPKIRALSASSKRSPARTRSRERMNSANAITAMNINMMSESISSVSWLWLTSTRS